MTARLRALYPAAAALALAAATAAPAAAQAPVPVGPNMYFTATVNGVMPGVTPLPIIKVVCPGPITPGETGHPVAGQTVEVQAVLPANSAQVGFTGSAAHQIDAIFGTPAGAVVNPPVVLAYFFLPTEIPTSLNLPCSGTGVVSFVPIPTSPTARGVAVPVEFLNIAL